MTTSETDVIVIGSGFAGLAAAVAAAEAGAAVVVLEKMLAPGGNSIISHGGIAAPGTDLQQHRSIADTPERMYQDMLQAGEGLNHPELVSIVTERAREAFVWTQKLGVPYYSRVDHFGGHSLPRCYTPKTMTGAPLVKQLLLRLKQLQVPVQLGTYVHSLKTTATGAIVGVTVCEKYRYGQPQPQPTRTIAARRGVIAACGGFAGDIAFRRAQDPRLTAELQSTTKASSTAEVLRACCAAGANLIQPSHIQLGPWTSPDESGFGAGPLFGDYVALPYGLLVNRSGQRFVNELGNRKTVSEAMLAQQQPVIGIADQTGVDHAGWDLARPLKKGVVQSFTDLEPLAECFGLPLLDLQTTLDRFNTMVQNRHDADWGKPIPERASKLCQAPFYAMRMWPKVHYTMGGLQINTRAEVIHRSQEPIPGLYAAGESTGGIHGACRLGSCAITECLVMGRIAGEQAAARQ